MPTSKLLTLAVALVIPTIVHAQATEPATMPSTEPTTAQSDESKAITLEGFIAPRDAFKAKFEPKAFGGELKVTQVVANGATVKQGETLITFDATDLKDAILSAAADVEAAKAGVAKAEADVTLGDRAEAAALEKNNDQVADAQRDLDYAIKQDAPNFLKRLELQDKSMKAQIDDQNDELDQLRKMYSSESLTNATADIVVKRAVRQLEQTQASYELGKMEMEKQKATEYVDKQQDAQRALESAKQSLDEFNAAAAQGRVTRATALTKARIALRAAQRQLSELEQDKTSLTIVAPHEGVAYFGDFSDGGSWSGTEADAIEVGKKKSAGATLITVLKPGSVRVVAKASDEQLSDLAPGKAVRVTSKLTGETAVDGKITSIAALPSADGNFAAEIDLVSADAKLVPGTKASIEVTK